MKMPETAAEDRARLVASLGIPADAAAPARYIEHGGEISGACLAELVDGEVAERTWRRWNRARAERSTPAFRGAFQALLSSGAAMGYSVDRFRWACQNLPEPDAGGQRWVEPFERAVAARNALDLRLQLHSEVRDAFLATNSAAGKQEERWDSIAKMMADGLFYELGIVVPRVELLADDLLAPTELRIEVNDVRLPRLSVLPADRVLVNDTVDRLTLLNVHGEPAVNPAGGFGCATIAATDLEICGKAGLTTWTRMGHAILTLSGVVRRLAGAFVNGHLAEFFAEKLAEAFPRVVEEMKQSMSIEAIAQVLRALVDEEISIRNLERIFEVLTLPDAPVTAKVATHILFGPPVLRRRLTFRDYGRDASALEQRLSRVRACMAREISYKYARGSNTLVVYLLDTELEKRLSERSPLSSRDRAALIRAFEEEMRSLPPGQKPLVLTIGSARLRLRKELAPPFPSVAVISYQELSPDMNIQAIARIEAPEVSDLFARLGRPKGERASRPIAPSDDPLVATLLSARDRIIATAGRRRKHADLAKPLLDECLDALLAELVREGSGAELASALPGRTESRVAWHRVLDLVLALGRAASEAVEPIPPRFTDLARVRGATHRLARAIADAGLPHE